METVPAMPSPSASPCPPPAGGEALRVASIMSATVLGVGPDCVVSDAAARMARARVGAVLVLDAGGGLLGLFTERDLLARVVGAGRDARTTAVGEVMTREVLALEPATPLSEAFDLVAGRGFRHIPVLDAGRAVGVVSLRDLFRVQLRVTEAQLDQELAALHEARRLLDLSAEARARELLQVNERLRELALTDELTGLHNHRYFVERLASEVSRSVRHGLPLALLFVDIDRFKRVNDTHGHQAGDEVLRGVAGVLRTGIEGDRVIMRIRRSDVVARYGGEEFAVLLPMTPSSGAAVVAERLRAVIEASPIPLGNGRAVPITVSVGVATSPEHARSDGALLRAADEALYRAKQGGRNRVELAGAPGEPDGGDARFPL